MTPTHRDISPAECAIFKALPAPANGPAQALSSGAGSHPEKH